MSKPVIIKTPHDRQHATVKTPWQAVPLVTAELRAKGYTGGEGGQCHVVKHHTERVHRTCHLLLEVGLCLYESDAVDAFIHAERVFPVVRALCVCSLVLDAHGVAGTHVLYHYRLLHAAHLCSWRVLCITALADTIRREVAVGSARIADGHGEVALLISLQ